MFDGALLTLGMMILIGGALWVAGSLLVKSGWLHIPAEMKNIYHATREWLAKAGWGEDTGASRYHDAEPREKMLDETEYPNRREQS
jgi:hypothetical protein